jgi:hypothetical protein
MLFLVIYCMYLKKQVNMAYYKAEYAYNSCADLCKKYHNIADYLGVTEVNKLEKKKPYVMLTSTKR